MEYYFIAFLSENVTLCILSLGGSCVHSQWYILIKKSCFSFASFYQSILTIQVNGFHFGWSIHSIPNFHPLIMPLAPSCPLVSRCLSACVLITSSPHYLLLLYSLCFIHFLFSDSLPSTSCHLVWITHILGKTRICPSSLACFIQCGLQISQSSCKWQNFVFPYEHIVLHFIFIFICSDTSIVKQLQARTFHYSNGKFQGKKNVLCL